MQSNAVKQPVLLLHRRTCKSVRLHAHHAEQCCEADCFLLHRRACNHAHLHAPCRAVLHSSPGAVAQTRLQVQPCASACTMQSSVALQVLCRRANTHTSA
eukprot:566442-Pelagomonas_calceolata.AAC.16